MIQLPVIADSSCTRCNLHSSTSRVCIMSPPKRSRIMVVGEAPGKREEETGVLFNGQSGRLLWDALAEHGIQREDVYVANAVSCRPPQNRTPKKGEIKACHHWLQAQLKVVKPRFVVLLGNVPLISVTGKAGIKKARGRVIERDGIIFLPMYHPAFVLRDDRNRPAFEADIRYFKQIVEADGIPQEKALDFTIVQTNADFENMLLDLEGTVSFDIESTGLYPWEPDRPLPPNVLYKRARKVGVVSIGFGTRKHQWCWPINHPGATAWPDLDEMFRRVDKRLKNCILVGQFAKFDTVWCKVRHGVTWKVAFDTGLAHYMLDENAWHGLKELAQVHFGAPNYDESTELKTGERGSLKEHCLYLAHDVYYTRKFRFLFATMLAQDEGVRRVFDEILMPCARLYVDMEYHGVYIDTARMQEVETELRKRLKIAEKKLAKYGSINWRSTKQLAKLLFEDLGISPLDRTAGGAYSTNESVLLRIEHPVSQALLDYRSADQLLKMFIDGWRDFLIDHRLHPNFKLHGTVTGRPSCEHPNLQQVPRDELIRSLITAPPGWVLVEIDLSQIEMRIAAELSGDEALYYAFTHGIDVHWLTAMRELSRGFGMRDEVLATASAYTGTKQKDYLKAIDILLKMGPDKAAKIDKVWKEVRKKAKAVNFGYLFGMWWKKFKIYARDNYGLQITDKQAQDSRVAFFHNYKALGPWHDRQRRYAQRNGYVRSLSGAKRRLPEAMSHRDSPKRAEAQRQAINSPVQRFACELNLMVLLELREAFSTRVLRPVGTIHDAILMEVREDYVVQVATSALKMMQRPKLLDVLDIKLRVPICGEVKIGPWGKGVSLDEYRQSLQG